jgi:hypothetical protein
LPSHLEILMISILTAWLHTPRAYPESQPPQALTYPPRTSRSMTASTTEPSQPTLVGTAPPKASTSLPSSRTANGYTAAWIGPASMKL